MGNFLCGVEMVKRFVNVHLHCIVGNVKKINEMSTLPPLEKFLRTPMRHMIVTKLCPSSEIFGVSHCFLQYSAFASRAVKLASCPGRHLTLVIPHRRRQGGLGGNATQIFRTYCHFVLREAVSQAK